MQFFLLKLKKINYSENDNLRNLYESEKLFEFL